MPAGRARDFRLGTMNCLPCRTSTARPGSWGYPRTPPGRFAAPARRLGRCATESGGRLGERRVGQRGERRPLVGERCREPSGGRHLRLGRRKPARGSLTAASARWQRVCAHCHRANGPSGDPGCALAPGPVRRCVSGAARARSLVAVQAKPAKSDRLRSSPIDVDWVAYVPSALEPQSRDSRARDHRERT